MVLQVILASASVALVLIGLYQWRASGRPLVLAGGLMLVPQIRALGQGLGFDVPPTLYITLAIACALGVTAYLVMSSVRKPKEIWLLVAAMGVIILYSIASPTSRSIELALMATLVVLCGSFAVVAIKRSVPAFRGQPRS